jgi:tellurite resistance protein TerC
MPLLATASAYGWAALIAAIGMLLVVDLFFAHRGADRVSLRTAAAWSALWLAVGVGFALVVLALMGGGAAGDYLAGFLMEKALSLDNVFVIAVLLGSFAVPQALKADVLTFGIVGALLLRAVFIVVGVTLLDLFHPALYVMGALLVVTGVRIARSDDGGEGFANGRLMRALRRVLPMSAEFDGRRLTTRSAGRRLATPLLAALLAVALADVVFAIDSIPAVLAITTDTFLVFAANAFALLGLRALYFLLDGAAQRFEHLHLGLGALLVYVGAKMLSEDLVHIPTSVSLAVIVVFLGGAVGASLLTAARRERHSGAAV